MSNPFTQIPLAIANADEEIFARSPNGETTIIKAIGWAIIIASVVAGIAFYVFLHSMSDSIILSFGGAAVMVIIIILFDRTLLRDESKIKLFFRFLISVCIALFISVPVKVNMASESLKSYIVESTARHNQDLRDQVYSAREEIDDRLEEINRGIIDASVRDENGRLTQSQTLVELRRLKAELVETRDQKIADVEASIENQMQVPDTSFISQMGTFIDLTVHPSKANDPIAIFLNVVILLLFILTEALPSILRMTLQKSNYIRAVEFKNSLVQKIQGKIEEIQTLLIESDSIQINDMLLKRQDYYVQLSRQAVTELKSTDELQKLYAEILKSEEEYQKQLIQEQSQIADTADVDISAPSQNGKESYDPEAPEYSYK